MSLFTNYSSFSSQGLSEFLGHQNYRKVRGDVDFPDAVMKDLLPDSFEAEPFDGFYIITFEKLVSFIAPTYTSLVSEHIIFDNIIKYFVKIIFKSVSFQTILLKETKILSQHTCEASGKTLPV